MSIISDFFDTMTGVSEKSDETILKIEAILLHVRARQIVEQTSKDIVLGICMGVPLALIFEFLRFVSYPFTNTFRFLICVSVTMIVYFFSDLLAVSETKTYIYTYLVTYVLSDTKSSLSLIRVFLFDMLDLVSFGKCTKSYAKFVVSSERTGCETMVRRSETWYQPNSIALSFYTNRLPLRPVHSLELIESEFNEIAGTKNEDYIVDEMFDDYWKDFKDT